MHSNFSALPDSDLLATTDPSAKRSPAKPADLLILTEFRVGLYHELHLTAGQVVRPPAPRKFPRGTRREYGAIDDALAHDEEVAV